MRLRSLIDNNNKKEEIIPLNEGIRFGANEMKVVQSRKNDFRVGLEFEFLVNKGVDFLTKSISDEATAASSEFANRIGPVVDNLTRELSDLAELWENEDTPSEIMDSLKDIVVLDNIESMDFIIGIHEDIIKNYISTFEKIAVKSMHFISFDYTHDVYAMGVWSGAEDPQKISMVKAASRSAEALPFTEDPEEQKKNLKRIYEVLRFISSYLENDTANIPYDKLENHIYVYDKIMEVLIETYIRESGDDGDDDDRSKIEIVWDSQPLPEQWIEDIKPEMTVVNGAELVTIPLKVDDAFTALKEMGPYIRSVGGTDNTTGLHVNISIKDNMMNPIKAITMLDIDFFQNISPSGRKVFKYDPRSHVDSIKSMFSKHSQFIDHLAMSLAARGTQGFIDQYERIVKQSTIKNSSVNVLDFFDARVPSGRRRVEFRFFGGAGYESRSREIFMDILHIIYALIITTDEDAERKKYLQSIIKLLDRAIADTNRYQKGTTFSDVVNKYRK